MAILDKLNRRQGFTETEQALADYILSHAELMGSMSISQLADATYSSNASIVRFCRKLGVDGYRTFRVEIASELERQRANTMNVNPDQPFVEGAGTRDIMSSIASLSRQAVDDTYAAISSAEIQRAARLVRQARHVVLYATGDTRVSIQGFSNLLLKLGIACIMGDQLGDNLIVSNFLGPQDVAFIVTYTGTLLTEADDGIRLLLSRGCRIVLITANERAAEHLGNADCVTLLPRSETRYGRIATYYSQECIRFALNCIYGEYFSRTWTESMETRERYTSNTLPDTE